MINRKRPGFTLIELVTIALFIGVQLAILFPVMEKSREEDRKSTCQSNLKQCAFGLQMSLNDWDVTLPSSACVVNVPGQAPTQAEVTHFLTGVDCLPSKPGTISKSWAEVMSRWYVNPGVVFCPSDTPRSRLSYWYKYAVDLAWRDQAIQARREPDFAWPDKTIVFYEHAGWHTGDAGGIKNGVTINVAYLDTHVASVTVKNGPTAYPAATDETSGASAVRLGEPMYFNFDNTTNTGHTGTAGWVDPRRYYDKF